MSLYIGNDIIHITDGSNSLSELKSGILSNTVLHNDFEFLTYDLYPVSVKEQGPNQYCAIFGWEVYYSYNQLYSSALKEAITNDLAFYLDSNMKVYNMDSSWKFTSKYGNDDYLSSLVSAPNERYYIPTFNAERVPGGSKEPHNCKNTYTPIKYIIVMRKRKLISGKGCKIKGTTNNSASKFIVGNLDISNIKYVSKGIINNHYKCPSIDGYHQLIDASKISGSIDIISNSSDGTIISKGGYPIIKGSAGIIGVPEHFTFSKKVKTKSYTFIHEAKKNSIHKVIFYIDNIKRCTRIININDNIITTLSDWIYSEKSCGKYSCYTISQRIIVEYVVTDYNAYLKIYYYGTGLIDKLNVKLEIDIY